MLRFLIGVIALVAFTAAAPAQIRITEWTYSSTDGEFIEFTNVGGTAIDMTGWSYDDDSRLPGSVSLTPFGLVQPGESVILSELSASDFRINWGLPLSVDVIGGNTVNLGRNDEINLYDASNAQIDRLTYGDQNIPGTIRTLEFSGNPNSPSVLGTNNVAQWSLSFVGDSFGSYSGLGGSVANPGRYIPEPSALALLTLGGAVLIRRRS